MDNIEVLTIDEISEILKVSKGLVLKVINGKLKGTPRLACIKIGRRKLVRRSRFEEWLELCDGLKKLQAGDLHNEEPLSTGLRNQITQ